MFIKIAAMSMFLASALTMASVSPSAAVTMHTVKCPNGKTVLVPDSQLPSRACALATKRLSATNAVNPAAASFTSGGGQAAAGNPCGPGKSTKGCRDWILGNPKPPVRPK